MSRRALILVGHGSSRHPASALPIQALARALAARGDWDQVAAVFMKQAPPVAGVLDRIAAEQVVVVPVFAGQGYYTDTLIPAALGLDSRSGDDGRRVVYTAPVGCDPRVPDLMAARARARALAAGWDPAGCSLVLIAHGSSRPGGSGNTAQAIAAAMRVHGGFAQVVPTFLEQAPHAADWAALATCERVVALPLLVAQGMHASQDIVPLFGLSGEDSGPVVQAGHQVVLTTGLGAEPELVDIVAAIAHAGLCTGHKR